MDTIITDMVRMRDHAISAGCSIKRWRLTDPQAHELADHVAWTTHPPRFPSELYQSMREGNCQIFGCLIEVRD